jgi:FkbM family methyltransferase
LDEVPSISENIQVLKREDGLELLQTPLGTWWMPEGNRRSLAVLLAQQMKGVYGEGEDGVKPGDVVLDCGAHVGIFTRKLLAMGARVVVAVEISPKNIECLRRNFREETQAGSVVIYPKGVWNREEFLTLYSDERNTAGDSVVISEKRAESGSQVPLTTIDKLVEELELSQVDFIKMDIKGAAAQALEGAEKTLARYNPRLAIATEEASDDPVEISKIVSSFKLGYQLRCGACTARPNEVTWRDLLGGMRNHRVYPLVLFFFV